MMLIYLLIINALSFLLMLIDKQKAKKGLWRIPEKTLLAIALLGGSLGGIVGMKMFRHKTKHLKFSLGLPLFLTVQIIIGVILFTFL